MPECQAAGCLYRFRGIALPLKCVQDPVSDLRDTVSRSPLKQRFPICVPSIFSIIQMAYQPRYRDGADSPPAFLYGFFEFFVLLRIDHGFHLFTKKDKVSSVLFV